MFCVSHKEPIGVPRPSQDLRVESEFSGHYWVLYGNRNKSLASCLDTHKVPRYDHATLTDLPLRSFRGAGQL